MGMPWQPDDPEEELVRFRNHYECPECGATWTDDWSCQVDDECGECGTRDISPHHSDDIDEDGEVIVSTSNPTAIP